MRYRIAVIAVLAGLLVTGCGGSLKPYYFMNRFEMKLIYEDKLAEYNKVRKRN
jgi:hypothetical protein